MFYGSDQIRNNNVSIKDKGGKDLRLHPRLHPSPLMFKY